MSSFSQPLLKQLLLEPALGQGSDTDDLARALLFKALQDIREVLHRTGRLSSKNEALDEVAKLLFAHVVAVKEGLPGIRHDALVPAYGETAAIALGAFVSHMFRKHLPPGLLPDEALETFELRLAADEERYASELIRIFEQLSSINSLFRSGLYSSIDLINDAFGQFLSASFVDEKELSQYLTPPEVVRFMVRLWVLHLSEEELSTWTDPALCTANGLILDPSCGVGSFLIESLRQLGAIVEQRHGPDGFQRWLHNLASNAIVGIDKSPRMIRLAATNLAMFGIPSANLYLANALIRTGRDGKLTDSIEGKVGLILTNPPFGAEFEDGLMRYRLATQWASRPPKQINSELLFMERYLGWLRPGGSLLTIVPDSILTNRGLFQDLRRAIAPFVEIKAVVSLPAVTFASAGTTTKTSVLFLKRVGPNHPKEARTFFAICHNIGYDVVTQGSHRKKVNTGQSDLPGILEAYATANGSLRYGRYKQDVAAAPRWDATYHASLAPEIEELLRYPRANDVFVRDVARLELRRDDPRRLRQEKFMYIEISDIDSATLSAREQYVPSREAPSRARLRVRAGDVLVSTVRPENRTVAVVLPHQDGAFCSTGFAVLRPTAIDPYLLANLLRSDFCVAQLLRNNVGVAYPAIDADCVLDVLLPITWDELRRLEPLARAYAVALERLRSTLTALDEEYKRAVSSWLRTRLPEPSSKDGAGSLFQLD